MQPPLRPGWERRVSASGREYFANPDTGESSLRRPEPLSAVELRRLTELCRDTTAEWVSRELPSLGAGEAEDVAHFLVAEWERSATAEAFARELADEGDGGVGLCREALVAAWHLIHVAHPVKKGGGLYTATLQYREHLFDPAPPPGWQVRESERAPGVFYYLHTATGRAVAERPSAAGGGPAPREDEAPREGTRESAPQPPAGAAGASVLEVALRSDAEPPFLLRGGGGSAALTAATRARPAAPAGGRLVEAAARPSALLTTRRKLRAPPGKFRMPAERAAPLPSTARRPRPAPGEPLPIAAHREELLGALRGNRAVVVVGETGSGKTTQLPQYAADAGDLVPAGKAIAVTQPRRVAAQSAARRVAAERRTAVGAEVGYAVRFDEQCSAAMRIKYVTDGMLLREMISDPELTRYAVVMIDEVHERTVTTDVLLFPLRRLLQPGSARSDLRVVAASATVDADRLAQYFAPAARVCRIPGRAFPVETLYLHGDEEGDWFATALKVIFEIHAHEAPGDILLFLTGQDEIDAACDICLEWYEGLQHGQSEPMAPLEILPLYAALPADQQLSVFAPAAPGARKVVISTNIAETSLTIDGIAFVIDCGFAKQKTYDTELGIDRLLVSPIAKSSARQRAGRAGRTGPGKCFRLYTEDCYDAEMPLHPVPEMQRVSLEATVLQLKVLCPGGAAEGALLDPPPAAALTAALRSLYHLGALDREGSLTAAGRAMAALPVEPRHARLVTAGAEHGCLGDAAAVAALLNCPQQVLLRPRGREGEAADCHRRLAGGDGDHAALAEIMRRCADPREARCGWCEAHCVSHRAVEAARQIAGQLARIARQQCAVRQPPGGGAPAEQLRRAVCCASPMRCARRAAERSGAVVYRTMTAGVEAAVHPSSALGGSEWEHSPEWVVYDELVETRRAYLRCVLPVTPGLIAECLSSLYRPCAEGAAASGAMLSCPAAVAMRRELAELRADMRTAHGGGSDSEGQAPRPQRRPLRGGGRPAKRPRAL